MTATTLPGLLIEHAQARPDAVALRNKHMGVWEEITWSGYLQGTERAAYGLHRLGIRAGDAVAILSDNRPEWVYADLAVQALGARSVGVYQTNPEADVQYVVDHSKAKVLICEDQEQVDKAIAIRDQTPSVERVVVIDPRGTRGYDDPRLMAWDDLVAQAPDAGWFAGEVAQRDPADPTMIVYTSGTTGPPKGAMLSSHNVVQTAAATAALMGNNKQDCLLSYLPLCHVAEKTFTLFLPLSVGAVVHFGECIDTVRVDLREVSPTVFLGVPRIWEKMHAGVTLRMKDASWLKRSLYDLFLDRRIAIADRRRTDEATAWDSVVWAAGDLLVFRALQEKLGLRRCRLPVSGAAPISEDLLRWFHGIGVPILEGYGQTECGGVSHLNPPGQERIGSVGQVAPTVECRLAEDGEVLVHGPCVFHGYLHNPEATARTIDEDGWLHTGDIGDVDDEGYLRITGRKKEIIITAGGKNLSPEKIENALKVSPYIREAIAIGDRRKFIGALIQIDAEAVGDWAARRQIAYGDFADLAGNPDVVDLVKAEVKTSNDLLARVEQVRSFRLLPKELHQDDGELTATQKVRRSAVQERWGELIESMYA